MRFLAHRQQQALEEQPPEKEHAVLAERLHDLPGRVPELRGRHVIGRAGGTKAEERLLPGRLPLLLVRGCSTQGGGLDHVHVGTVLC